MPNKPNKQNRRNNDSGSRESRLPITDMREQSSGIAIDDASTQKGNVFPKDDDSEGGRHVCKGELHVFALTVTWLGSDIHTVDKHVVSQLVMGEKDVNLHCNNCSGQNKNRYAYNHVLKYILYIV